MNEQVRFIRKNGRVIPIRVKAPASKAPSVSPGVAAASVGIFTAVATYAFMRKFKVSKIAQLANLQKAARKSGVALVAGNPTATVKRFDSIMGMPINPLRFKGPVLNRTLGADKLYDATHVINPKRLAKSLSDKRAFAKHFAKNPAAIPKTMGLDEALAKVGGDKRKLKSLFPGQRILIKPSRGGMAKVSDFATERTLASAKARKAFRNPKSFIVQERLALTGEYRAHYLNGKVFGISHRRIPNKKIRASWDRITGGGGGAFVPVVNPFKRRQIRKFVEKSVSVKLRKGESVFVAFDVGQTKKGLKLIEANLTPGSFFNPVINRQFQRHATGRWGKGVSGVGAVKFGSISAGVTYTAHKRQK